MIRIIIFIFLFACFFLCIGLIIALIKFTIRCITSIFELLHSLVFDSSDTAKQNSTQRQYIIMSDYERLIYRICVFRYRESKVIHLANQQEIRHCIGKSYEKVKLLDGIKSEYDAELTYIEDYMVYYENKYQQDLKNIFFIGFGTTRMTYCKNDYKMLESIITDFLNNTQ